MAFHYRQDFLIRNIGLFASQLREMGVESKNIMPLPVLLTVRCPEEGGLNPSQTTEERVRIALSLLPHAAALDWEIAHLGEVPQLVAAAHAAGVPIIASAHDFEKPPPMWRIAVLWNRRLVSWGQMR